MNSRERILSAVKSNQSSLIKLPHTEQFERHVKGSHKKFVEMLILVGGTVAYVSDYEEVGRIIKNRHTSDAKIISLLPEKTNIHYHDFAPPENLTDFNDIDVTIIKAKFGVAENGAVWVTEQDMRFRVLPFICQHLAIVLEKDTLVCTMHDAYEVISETVYGFGTFIAGPSKTADIEQSLVIGAHGPRSLTVFIMM